MIDRSYVPRPESDDEDEDDTPDVPRSFTGFGELHPKSIAEKGKASPPPSNLPEHKKRPS